jgi:predicted DsbA family dithiol-disulfide isomerase
MKSEVEKKSHTIDVISDVVCPWCFIGKRNLEAALASWRQENPGEETPQVRWHAFQLNPGLAQEGIPRERYVAEKFGGPERAKEIYARVARAGSQAGIDFRFDAIQRQPNTVDAHRLIHRADAAGVQDKMVEALFRGYFLDAVDLTNRDNLVDLASGAGLDREEIAAYLAGEQDRLLIENADHRARTIGVQGVPFFIFDQKYAVSGAQPPEVLLDILYKAREDIAAAPQ